MKKSLLNDFVNLTSLLVACMAMLSGGGCQVKTVQQDLESNAQVAGNAQAGQTLALREPAAVLKFDLGAGGPAEGWTQLLPTTRYSDTLGYGFFAKQELRGIARGGDDLLRQDFITSEAPFYFVADLPEGNYEVTVLLGDAGGSAQSTVKAESRRLMLENIRTPAGTVAAHSFVVNVRTPRIDANRRISLKPRELGYLNWDDKLTLEFNGERPCIAAIEIKEAPDPITLYLAGNSTVVDQEYEPWAAWGQMIPRFFDTGVVVANYAESGEALKSFVAERRLEKIISRIKPGDYLFVEFAHNDQKPGASYVVPFTTYKEQLRYFIAEARSKGAHPVLVTSMHRRRFDEEGKIINTLDDYPEAVRQTARETGVPLIDLNAMSREFYEALGPEASKKAFVHYPAGSFPGQQEALKDDTHFSAYGAYQLARCVAEGIRTQIPDLAHQLRADIKPYKPSEPDPVQDWHLPQSPDVTMIKPDGN